MKRTTISLFLFVLVLIGVSEAQETKYIAGGLARQMALGGNPTNAYLMDYTDVYTNPAWAVKYGDLIYSELGYNFAGYHASGQSVGFTYAVSSGLAVGLSLGKQEGPLFVQNSYGSQLGGNTALADDFLGAMNTALSSGGYTPISSATLRPLQVYGAFKLSGMTLGAAFYRVGYSASQDYTAAGPTNTKDELSVGQTGFKAGMLLDMDVMLLDASALLRINSASGTSTPPAPTASSEIKATGTEFALNARLFIKLSDKFTFVPMGRFSTFGYEPEAALAGQPSIKPNKYGRTEIEFGAGSNITVPGGHVFAGLSLESISLKNDETIGAGAAARTTKYASSVLSLPKVNLGAEFEIASWLTGRLGYFKAYSTRTTTTEAPAPALKQEYKETIEFKYAACSLAVADQLLSLGVGIHFDRLSIDGYLCEQWLADGPYIASGAANAMFGILSMSYRFN